MREDRQISVHVLIVNKREHMNAIVAWTGMPDGIFNSYQNSQVEYVLEGLWMETIGIFNGHLEYFKEIW
jgi:hypothetical protein